ncbi:hypothetical protein OIU76_000609, partial [Salix suchowensis]
MADLGLGPVLKIIQPCSAHLARRGNGSNNSLSRGAENVHGVSPPLSPVVTTSIANESLSSSSYSNSKASENNGSHSNSKVMVTAATTTKKLGEEVVSLFLLSAAIAPKGKDVLSSSPSKAKENGGSKVREDSESLAAKIDPRDGHATNDMTTILVWVKFPNLPLKCWLPFYLSKIDSVLGKSIQNDMLTSYMSQLSYARIFVEIDLLVNLPHTISITLPNGISLKQPIIYETLPKFCIHCKVISHILPFFSHTLDKNESKALVSAKEVSTTIKVTVKWRVPIKEVIPEHEKPIVQNLNE